MKLLAFENHDLFICIHITHEVSILFRSNGYCMYEKRLHDIREA